MTLEIADGRSVKGRKIGLTARAMQLSSQIDEPDCAPPMDDMFFAQGGDMFFAEGGDIPISRFIAPRVDVELAFILGKPLKGPGVTLFDVLSATDYVTPAIEIIDARIEQFDRDTLAPRKVFDTISDFAANAGIVLGVRPVKPLDFDLRWVGAMLFKNGVIEETGLAAAVLNHPANGVAWLANKLAFVPVPPGGRRYRRAAGGALNSGCSPPARPKFWRAARCAPPSAAPVRPRGWRPRLVPAAPRSPGRCPAR